MTFEFSRISKTNLTSVEYLKRHFLNHPTCFFWNRPLIDRWNFCSRYCDIYCTGLELFPELSPPKNLLNITYLRHFWYLQGSWLNVVPSFCQQILLRANYFHVYFMKVYVLMYPKRFMRHVTFEYVAKMKLLQVVITCKIAVFLVTCCLFWLTKPSIWWAPAIK